MAKQARIGFIGLGLMGYEMVRNLLAHGFPVIGFDIVQKKIDAITQLGGGKIEAPEHLPSVVDVIILSLPNSNVVDSVVKKDLNLLETGRGGLVLIDMTTADPVMSEALASELRQRDLHMLDVTVSGGPELFAQKKVTLMAGGETQVFDKCKPIFSALSENILHVGKNGSGALMKLLVNLYGGLSRMALAESLALCKKAGMSQYMLMEVLKSSPHHSKSMESKAIKMIEKNFSPAAGKIAFHLKDVRLMLDLGKRLNFPLFLTGLHAQALASEVSKGRGDWDNTDIISFYEDLANIQ